MSQLMDRDWELQVGVPGRARSYRGMALKATVRLGVSGGGDGATVTAYMPSSEMVGALGTASAYCRILASYGGPGSAVEIGQGTVIARSMRDRRGTADPHVEWALSNSSFLRPPISVYLPGPVKVSEIIEAVRRELGIPAGPIELGDDLTIARGYLAEGSARTVLADLCETSGSVWEPSSGRLTIRPIGQPSRIKADLWNAGSGLTEISGPAGKGEIRASALLRPAIRPGDVVRLRDQVYNGDVVVREVTHDIDTEGSAWHTSIVGVAREG